MFAQPLVAHMDGELCERAVGAFPRRVHSDTWRCALRALLSGAASQNILFTSSSTNIAELSSFFPQCRSYNVGDSSFSTYLLISDSIS